jgi:hypothetical protein
MLPPPEVNRKIAEIMVITRYVYIQKRSEKWATEADEVVVVVVGDDDHVKCEWRYIYEKKYWLFFRRETSKEPCR